MRGFELRTWSCGVATFLLAFFDSLCDAFVSPAFFFLGFRRCLPPFIGDIQGIQSWILWPKDRKAGASLTPAGTCESLIVGRRREDSGRRKDRSSCSIFMTVTVIFIAWATVRFLRFIGHCSNNN